MEQTLTKKEIRSAVLAERRAIDSETHALDSMVICRKILGLDFYQDCENLCLYMPINNEVDVMLLAEAAEEDGKKVWIPKVTGDTMVFNEYREDCLVKGAYDITESSSETVLEGADDKTLIIMPGAVFTPDRDRIGYGGGFYDKYLESHPDCRTIAACFDLQVLPEIPVEEHDRKPDLVISEVSIYA